jgi:hypothetical protein
MIVPTWQELPLATTKIPAKPSALWTRVHDCVGGPVKLRIRANGTWKYSDITPCGPDGSRAAGFAADALNASALLGTLIGKIGGSAADKHEKEAFTFVAASYAVIVLDAKIEGVALYLTMNDQATHFGEHSGEIDVTIEEARSG